MKKADGTKELIISSDIEDYADASDWWYKLTTAEKKTYENHASISMEEIEILYSRLNKTK